MKLVEKIFGTYSDRELKKIYPIVDKIESLRPEMQALSDEELKKKTPWFKERLEKGETLDDILPEAFAVVREAANAKTASVVVKGSAPAECIKDRENGFLCEDNDESLFKILKEALANRDNLVEMGIKAKESIPISWDVVIDQAIQRYEQIIKMKSK